MPDQLQVAEIQHPPFDEEVRAYLRAIFDVFAEHRSMTWEDWEEGFRRDANPGPEIALWAHAARVYQEFAADEPVFERRAAVFQCIVACLTSSAAALVGHVLQPGALTRSELERIAGRYFAPPA